jgi:hypothetical protein
MRMRTHFTLVGFPKGEITQGNTHSITASIFQRKDRPCFKYWQEMGLTGQNVAGTGDKLDCPGKRFAGNRQLSTAKHKANTHQS